MPGEDGRHPPGTRIDPVEAQEAINQLVALGYIEKPEDNREKAVAQAVSEWNYNLARSYMDAGLHTDAVALLADLVMKWPDQYRFGIQLAFCYQAIGRPAEARRLLEELFARKEKNAVAAQEKLRGFSQQHQDKTFEDSVRKRKTRCATPAGRGLLEPICRRIPDGVAAADRGG